MSDPYLDGTSSWWHLSRPSPELLRAVEEGWLELFGRALDVGCGLGTEIGWLADQGMQAVGVDVSAIACARAQELHPEALFVRADVRHLPFSESAFDLVLDRGCFHYLDAGDRSRYASELERALRPGGRLLLRASLRAAGLRNDIDEDVIRETFGGWSLTRIERALIPSDRRNMEVLLVRLERR